LHTAGYVKAIAARRSACSTSSSSAQAHLDRADIRFQPGINEDMAATAIWGTQQAELRGEASDGVFGLWQARAPRRSHRRRFPTCHLRRNSKHGGVLALTGDDHAADSTTRISPNTTSST
jgi:indolepyruvate ferredoxin oxidoreductase